MPLATAGCYLTSSDQPTIRMYQRTPLHWETEEFDLGGYHNTQDDTKIIIPTGGTGLYSIYCHLPNVNDNSNFHGLFIKKNGGVVLETFRSPESVLSQVHIWAQMELWCNETSELQAGLFAVQTSDFVYNWSYSESGKRIFFVNKVGDTNTYACSLRGGVTAINTDTETDLTWSVEESDYRGMHSPNSATVSIPVTGIYHINGYINWNHTALYETSIRSLILKRNGATVMQDRNRADYYSQSMCNQISWEGTLTAGDTVKLCAYQESGYTRNILSQFNDPYFTVRLVSS